MLCITLDTDLDTDLDVTPDTDLDTDLDITLDTDLDTDVDTTLDTDLHPMPFSLSHYEGVVIHNLNVPPLTADSTVTQHIYSLT